MSLELAEIEAPLSRFGSLISLVTSISLAILGIVGIFMSFDEVTQLNFVMISICSIIILLTSLLAFLSPWIEYKINFTVYSLLAVALYAMSIMLIPSGFASAAAAYGLIFVGILGIIIIFIDKRPNLGPEGNKHLYQAYGGILGFSMGILMLVLGIYIMVFNVAENAGNGTIPGNFYHDYILGLGVYNDGLNTYNGLRGAGIIVIVGSVIVMVLSVLRNTLGLKLSALIIFSGTIVSAAGLGAFSFYWGELDGLFFTYRFDEYYTQLYLKDPGVFSLGLIIFMLEFAAFFMVLYASIQSKPIEKWRTKRNHFLAAAEVATREQKLAKAIKYLEQAASWSSRLGEEDKAVELLTRVKQIRDKVIKMKKAQAAEKRKKQLDAEKPKA